WCERRLARDRGDRELEVHAKLRSLARRALDGERAAHEQHELARDREPESGAAETARGGRLALFELLEEALLGLRRDADAGVAHDDAQRDGVAADHDRL